MDLHPCIGVATASGEGALMERCKRCNKPARVMTMSYFNTQMICMECRDRESKHPLYEHAKRVELQACLQGNLNFGGIGLPDDLKQEEKK